MRAVAAVLGAVCAFLLATGSVHPDPQRGAPAPAAPTPEATVRSPAAGALEASERAGVDWAFIRAREGGRHLRGYVPCGGRGRSGVTIATGVDLGQRSRADIERLGLGAELARKLRPYALKKGTAAVAYLAAHPLVLSPVEAGELDCAVQDRLLASLISLYDRAAPGKQGGAAFDELPPEAQTVIASVAFQYGPDLKRATPRFWRYVTRRQWRQAVEELEDFGDRYRTRRAREAALLKEALRPDHSAGACGNDCC